MKFSHYALGAIVGLVSLQASACKVLLQDNLQLALNAPDIGNSDRLSLTRHYLTAREWTTEGAMASVDAAAFESELNPKALAIERGRNFKAFLVQLGFNPDDIDVHERVIKSRKGKIDPDDKWQVGVEFVPKCPSSGSQSLCNTPKLQGVVSYAVTHDTPGPPADSYHFTCGDNREPSNARFTSQESWTPRTVDTFWTLVENGKPLTHVCYRITTSAREYVGMTDDQGRTGTMQVLGPEYTRMEVKIDADKYSDSVSHE
ncbi:hypothetical protein AB4Y32_15665 [Paraburkholderia phymatum]|uniref:Uncharacterized protein n=1 Tax=Paraburkholderia phymatum TaxID=148447 RepID=A0ACC6U0V2_9BURK